MKPSPSSLCRQNLFWSLLPSLLFSLVLGTYFFSTRVAELNRQMAHDVSVLVHAYGVSLAGPLAAGHREHLQSVCNFLLEHNNIRTVAAYDADGDILAQSGPSMLPLTDGSALFPHSPSRLNPHLRETEGSLRALFAIHDSPLSPSLPTRTSDQVLGWLEIEVEPTSILIEKYHSVVMLLLGILVVIALNAAIAYRFSQQIQKAIVYTRKVLSRMADGDIETPMNLTAKGEIGELQSAVENFRNATLQWQRELQHSVDQATEDLRETLETIEIQNIELDLARKEALEASRIKSEFLANMSHEIRTPLNGVIGFANLLLKSDINPHQRDYLETILKSSESLLAIINDILDFSKIEAGKLALDQVPLNLNELVEDVVTMLAPMAYEKHLEQVSLFYSDVPQQIIGDPLRLKQILTNLVNNAIKFTQQGEIIVRVMLEDLRNHLAVIKIAVTDTGMGLTQEQQAALFNAFQQADNTTARRFGGTGLGLVISKHLVEQMRGQIGVESHLGQGSTFWFTFRTEVYETEKSPLALFDTSMRLAVCDNNATLRTAVRNLLEARQVQVKDFPDLTRLQTAIESDRYDALIIGINPEHPQYLDTARIVAANRHGSPILLLGNPVDQRVIKEILQEYPSPPFVNKPVVERKLCECLRELLTPSHPHQEEAPALFTSPESRLSIIAVDDNPANLKLITALLKELGVNVTACESGANALVAIQSQHCDLVLMDIQMPIMDGVETTRRIRDLEAGKQHTPIVAVTAHALANEKRHLLESGLDDYVTKPINEAQLLHIIRKWTGVNLKQSGRSTSAPSAIHHAPVDMAMGVNLAGGNRELADEMLEMLLLSIQQDRPLMETHFQEKRYAALLDAVHKLHGATRYTGVPGLQQAARALEENLKLKQYSQTGLLLQQLLAEMRRIEVWKAGFSPAQEEPSGGMVTPEPSSIT